MIHGVVHYESGAQQTPMEQNMKEQMNHALMALTLAAEDLAKAAQLVEDLSEAMKNDGTISPTTCAEFYFHLDTAYDAADTARKRVYHVNDMMNKHLIPSRLKDAGLDLIRVAAVARSFSIVTKTSATMLDKVRGFEWLRANGQGDIIQETVNAGTLSAFCRSLILEQGIEPPSDIIKVSTYDTTSMTRYRPKAGEA